MFDDGSDGSDLRAETDRRSPIDTVAPARDGAPERSNRGGEAERSVTGDRRRRRRRRRSSEGSRKIRRRSEKPGPSSENRRERRGGR